MAGGFDPYQEWFGIAPEEQPPNHYQLLRLPEFEADPAVIEAAADRLLKFLESQVGGSRNDDAKKVLGKLSMLRIDLLDEEQKVAYDARLRKQLANKAAKMNQAQASQPKAASGATAATPSRPKVAPKRPAPSAPAAKTKPKQPGAPRRPPADARPTPVDTGSRVVVEEEEPTPIVDVGSAGDSSVSTGGSSMADRARGKGKRRSGSGKVKKKAAVPVDANDESDEADEYEDEKSFNFPLVIAVSLVTVLAVGGLLWGIGFFDNWKGSDNRIAARDGRETSSETPDRPERKIAQTQKSREPSHEGDVSSDEEESFSSLAAQFKRTDRPAPPADATQTAKSPDRTRRQVTAKRPVAGETSSGDVLSPGLPSVVDGDSAKGESADDIAKADAANEEAASDGEDGDAKPRRSTPSSRPSDVAGGVVSGDDASADALKRPKIDVVKSPAFRAREEGEAAGDYLAAIGLEKEEDRWILANERIVKAPADAESKEGGLVAQVESSVAAVVAERAERKSQAKAERKGLDKDQEKALKELRKKAKKMTAEQQKAAGKAFKEEWSQKKKDFSLRVPVDPEARLIRATQLAKAFAEDKKKQTIEHLASTYNGIHGYLNLIQKIEKAQAAFKVREAEHQMLKDSYRLEYERDLSIAKKNAALALQAVMQLNRLAFEYRVLGEIGAVKQAVEEAGGELGPGPDFGSLSTRAARLQAAADKSVADLEKLAPFSEAIYRLPKRVVLMEDASVKELGKVDASYAGVSPTEDPAAYLLARGLTRTGDYWRFEGEKQFKHDILHANAYRGEIDFLIESFPEERRAALVAKQVKLDEQHKKMHEDLTKNVIPSKVYHNLANWLNRRRDYEKEKYPVDRLAERLLAVDDAIANLKDERTQFLSAVLERGDQVGMAYGDVASEDDVLNALEQTGGSIEPSGDFSSTHRKIQEMVNRP